MELDLADRKLLNLAQQDFPLVSRPYAALGGRLGISEDQCMERIRRMKGEIIREIGGIFDARVMGYQSCLIAFTIPEDKLDEGAQLVSQHPGVSHNYARTHQYNLWFTLALAPGLSLEAEVARLARLAGAVQYRIMPALRIFKIGVNFDMVEGKGDTGALKNQAAQAYQHRPPQPMSPLDIEAVRVLQEDLPVEPQPFLERAARLGLTEDQLFALMAGLAERGILRRYSAMLRHRAAGFSANAMLCWKAPPGEVEEKGRVLASFSAVSHAYQRPVFPDWPYNIFTMVHATQLEDCKRIAAEMQAKSGVQEFALLYGAKEYKKERVRYFLEDRALTAEAVR